MKKLYCLFLTDGNLDEFPDIRKQFFKRGIPMLEVRRVDVVFFFFRALDAIKLPADGRGHYVPVDDDSGHGFARKMAAGFLKQYGIDINELEALLEWKP